MHPNQVVNALLTGAVKRGATLAAIDCGGGEGSLTLMRGSRELCTVELSYALAEATAARLALLAGLSLVGSAERMARLRVRIAGELAEIIVAVRRTQDGLAAELRPLSHGGRAITAPADHALARCPKCKAVYPPREVVCASDGTGLEPARDDVRPGGTLGVYQLQLMAGAGGMGVVYFGTHALIGRKVAIKVMLLSMSGDAEMAGRFLIEARAASRLRHPSIVDVSDYGVLADGRPYLVMERLDGESLEDVLERRRVLPPGAALRLLRQVAEALEHAHQRGVIHQDLKPGNIFMLTGTSDEQPRCKVIDFGAARALSPAGDAAVRLERSGNILGTPLYMSPEHCCGRPTDARSDLYSLGVVLHQLVTGKCPFVFSDPTDILRAHVYEAAAPPSSPLGPLPPGFVPLLARLLAKRAKDRPQSAAELIDELAAVERGA